MATAGAATTETHQASGIKIGEVSPSGARVWVRRTKSSERFAAGMAPRPGLKATTLALPADTSKLQGACPGDAGQVRLTVKTAAGKRVTQTDWVTVGAESDFSHQFALNKLSPATAYAVTVETRGASKVDGVVTGSFRTAPAEDSAAPLDIAMLSCQKYSQRDDDRGFHLYDSIRAWRPHFLLSVGDNVYYDSDDPKVNHVSVARHHWHRMYSLPRVAECLRAVPGYWIKDDHDCYSDDCWPGYVNETMKPFTFEEGLKLFPEQTPMGPKTYRRFRWGRGLEVFLMEGRDWRTSNLTPDGPGKSIWGPEQKKWLEEGLATSTAHWKIIVSPTPLVGPDRKNKHDNHSNDAFTHEGREFRAWLAKNTRNDTFAVCGDRHWQYHSVDPESKVQEFGCGAASDSHASGTPGEDPRMHRFHRVKGGFLAFQVRQAGGESTLVIAHRDVRGEEVYKQTMVKKV